MNTGKHSKKRSLVWQLRWYLILIVEFALILSVYKISKYKKETAASEAANQELARAVTVSSPAPLYPTPTGETTDAENRDDGSDAVTIPAGSASSDRFPIAVDFDLLLQKNPDCVGWLFCEGTPINLAVMQGDDNTYYLYRTFDRVENAYGTIFMDSNGSSGFKDANNLIFGHNMVNDTMFGSLDNYREQEYFEEHPCLWLATERKNYRLDVVAGIVHTDDSTLYSTPISRKATDELIPYAISTSVFKSNAVYNPNANYVTLSTCCYDFTGARFAIICEMVEVK